MGREDKTADPDLRAVVTSDLTVPVLPLLTAGFLIVDMMSSLLCSHLKKGEDWWLTDVGVMSY